MKSIRLFLALCFLLAAAGCQPAEKKVELTVSAAASLQQPLAVIKAAFEKEHENITIQFNFGGSGALQQQISQGAPVDIFLSAAEEPFDRLVDEKIIDGGKAVKLLENRLVLVQPSESEAALDKLEDLGKPEIAKLALGTPETVPAGRYAKDALEEAGLFKELEGKIVYAKDVKAVLSYVESGNADAGFVYKTDALASKKAKTAIELPADKDRPIIYPAGVVESSENNSEAEQFFAYIQSDEGIKIFTEYGFEGLK